MSKRISGVELSKRTYLDGFVYTTQCKRCKQEVSMDFGEQYLSYPITGVPDTIHMYCEECDYEGDYGKITLDLIATIEEN